MADLACPNPSETPEEVSKMCEAMENMRNESKEEGREEMRVEARQHLIDSYHKLVQSGTATEVALSCLGLTPADVLA